MYHYVYKIVNKKNGMWYVGTHTSKCEPKYDDEYWGSNILLHNHRKGHEQNFEKWIIAECCTKEEAYAIETAILACTNAAEDPMSYNDKIYSLVLVRNVSPMRPRRLVCEGMQFKYMSVAAEYYGCSVAAIHNRVYSNLYPNFYWEYDESKFTDELTTTIDDIKDKSYD